VLKHVVVFICVVYIATQSALVGKYVVCRNMHGVSNIKFAML